MDIARHIIMKMTNGINTSACDTEKRELTQSSGLGGAFFHIYKISKKE